MLKALLAKVVDRLLSFPCVDPTPHLKRVQEAYRDVAARVARGEIEEPTVEELSALL